MNSSNIFENTSWILVFSFESLLAASIVKGSEIEVLIIPFFERFIEGTVRKNVVT